MLQTTCGMAAIPTYLKARSGLITMMSIWQVYKGVQYIGTVPPKSHMLQDTDERHIGIVT